MVVVSHLFMVVFVYVVQLPPLSDSMMSLSNIS